MLAPEAQAQILTFYYTDKRSIASISRELGINRKTVARVIKRREVLLEPPSYSRRSQLDPYKEVIRTHLRKDSSITGTAMLNLLRGHGYTGGITILRSFLLKERGRFLRPREAFLRLDFSPGEVAQVDWGEFGNVFADGVKIHCFAMVLAYSRMMYIEFTRSEKFEEFIRCHENAFRFFGGIPRECWYDNLKTAVSDRLGSLIRFNSRFMAYMGHHGIRPHACNVARGNEKGRVEDLIKYIRMNFWPGRTFNDFEDLNHQAIIWRNQIANVREHRSTRRVIKLLFESQEKPQLLSLNPTPYDTDEVLSRVVPPDFHFQYESNRYSVPWTLVGMTVTVRVNHNEVKVFYREKFISFHKRSYLKNRVFTKPSHQVGLEKRKPGAKKENWRLEYIKGLDPEMVKYIELIKKGQRSLKYELSRLIALVTIYGKGLVVSACTDCLKAGIIGVDNLELHLRSLHHPDQAELQPEPIQFEKEKLNRVYPTVDLRKYDALLFEGDNQRSASEENNNGNIPSSSRGTQQPQVEALEPGSERGLSENDRKRAGPYLQTSTEMDHQGESRKKEPDDPSKSQKCKISQIADNREF